MRLGSYTKRPVSVRRMRCALLVTGPSNELNAKHYPDITLPLHSQDVGHRLGETTKDETDAPTGESLGLESQGEMANKAAAVD